MPNSVQKSKITAHMLQKNMFFYLVLFLLFQFSKWSKLFPWAVLAIRGHLYSNDRPAVAILKQLQLLFNYSRCLRRTKRIASVEWPNYIRTALDWVFNTVSFSMGGGGILEKALLFTVTCRKSWIIYYHYCLSFIIVCRKVLNGPRRLQRDMSQ